MSHSKNSLQTFSTSLLYSEFRGALKLAPFHSNTESKSLCPLTKINFSGALRGNIGHHVFVGVYHRWLHDHTTLLLRVLSDHRESSIAVLAALLRAKRSRSVAETWIRGHAHHGMVLLWGRHRATRWGYSMLHSRRVESSTLGRVALHQRLATRGRLLGMLMVARARVMMVLWVAWVWWQRLHHCR